MRSKTYEVRVWEKWPNGEYGYTMIHDGESFLKALWAMWQNRDRAAIELTWRPRDYE